MRVFSMAKLVAVKIKTFVCDDDESLSTQGVLKQHFTRIFFVKYFSRTPNQSNNDFSYLHVVAASLLKHQYSLKNIIQFFVCMWNGEWKAAFGWSLAIYDNGGKMIFAMNDYWFFLFTSPSWCALAELRNSRPGNHKFHSWRGPSLRLSPRHIFWPEH